MHTIENSIEIAAPVTTLRTAITTLEGFRAWLSRDTEVDAEGRCTFPFGPRAVTFMLDRRRQSRRRDDVRRRAGQPGLAGHEARDHLGAARGWPDARRARAQREPMRARDSLARDPVNAVLGNALSHRPAHISCGWSPSTRTMRTRCPNPHTCGRLFTASRRNSARGGVSGPPASGGGAACASCTSADAHAEP